jgi:hypothetical protein
MIEKKNIMVLLLGVSLHFTFFSFVCAKEVFEPYPLTFLSFISYQIVDSHLEGQIYTQEIKVQIRNMSQQKITNLSLFLDGTPENVKVSKSMLGFGDIEPGIMVLSNDSTTVSIDMTKQNEPKLKLIWRAECEMNGEHIMDETTVIEDIN